MFDTPERPLPLQTRRFAVFAVILAACFALPLWQLFRFCLKSDFFSYIPLVPLISGYLIHLQRPNLPSLVRGTRGPAILCGVLGALILAVSIWARLSFQDLDRTSYLTGIVSGLLLSLLAAAFFLFGSKLLRLIAFPVAFMAFCIPLPDLLLDPISLFFQYTSAWTAVAFLRAVGTPVHLSDLTLDLSDIRITVAPECSGIHSTMVLLMTAFLAGHMFLKSPCRRAILVCFVLPLAILRNGFRIFVISELCVHIGPEMIDSPIHHHGGPIFFGLFLIPFFLLMIWLWKSEKTTPEGPSGALPIPNTL